MSIVRIALANVRPGSTPDESVALTRSAIQQASGEKAAIVCFPECHVPGYRMQHRALPPLDSAFLEEAWSTIAQAARDAKIAVVLGTERLVDGKARITTLVVDRDG